MIDEYDTIEHRKQVILVNQSVYLFDMTVRENFYEFYKYRDLDKPDDETINKYLKLCIADFNMDALCQNMSGGERQRIFLAICLSFMPKVILLDEPTSALDEKNAGNLISNVKKFCQENSMTLIIVSHSKQLAKQYADDCIELRNGADA
jgi:putative ABC transport system ATP-binding protein